MNRRLERAKAVAGAVVREVRAENLTFMAGSIAYHAFVSLLPFLLLMLVVISRIGGRDLAAAVLQAMAGYLTPGEIDVLVNAALRATGDAGLSALSVVVLVWGTLRIFRGLDTAFSDVYESSEANTVLDQAADAVVVFGALGLVLVVVSTADRLFGIPSLGPVDAVVRPLASMLVIALALLPMYYVFPDEDVTVREVVPGTVLTAGGLVALGELFRYYVRFSRGGGPGSDYGVVGVVILLITWLYFSGLLLLLGAAVNAVLAGRSEDVDAIAWGGEDPGADDAPFVEQLSRLDGAFDDDAPVRIEVGDEAVELPPPAEATVDVAAVDRPDLLGGAHETGRLTLTWDSWN